MWRSVWVEFQRIRYVTNDNSHWSIGALLSDSNTTRARCQQRLVECVNSYISYPWILPSYCASVLLFPFYNILDQIARPKPPQWLADSSAPPSIVSSFATSRRTPRRLLTPFLQAMYLANRRERSSATITFVSAAMPGTLTWSRSVHVSGLVDSWRSADGRARF